MYKMIKEKSKIFGVFMWIFQYPDKELVEELKNGSFFSILSSYLKSNYEEETTNSKIEDMMAELGELLKSYALVDIEKLYSDLKQEYSSLFIGYRKLLAPPYASVYWDKTGQLMREPAILLKKYYKEWGFEISDDYRDLPDHISLQLEFLYQLGDKAREDHIEEVYKAQREVIQEILLKWIYDFSDKIKEHEKLGFYSIIVDILIGILEGY